MPSYPHPAPATLQAGVSSDGATVRASAGLYLVHDPATGRYRFATRAADGDAVAYLVPDAGSAGRTRLNTASVGQRIPFYFAAANRVLI